jgi:hypothetical protein
LQKPRLAPVGPQYPAQPGTTTASITKRGSTYFVRVPRKGDPTVTKSFRTKAEAEKFQLVIESEMSRAVYVDRSEAARTTLRDALERYLVEVVPGKKGHQEAYRVRALMAEPFAMMSLAELSSKHFASYRDAELRRVSAKAAAPCVKEVLWAAKAAAEIVMEATRLPVWHRAGSERSNYLRHRSHAQRLPI